MEFINDYPVIRWNYWIQAQVLKVKDGDTIVVKSELEIKSHEIRIAGIDACENELNEKVKYEEFLMQIPARAIVEIGKEATNYMMNILDNKAVIWLAYDKLEKDKYNRYIAHAYIKVFKTWQDWSAIILEEGYGWVYRPKPTKLAAYYMEKEIRARKAGLKFWKLYNRI